MLDTINLYSSHLYLFLLSKIAEWQSVQKRRRHSWAHCSQARRGWDARRVYCSIPPSAGNAKLWKTSDTSRRAHAYPTFDGGDKVKFSTGRKKSDAPPCWKIDRCGNGRAELSGVLIIALLDTRAEAAASDSSMTRQRWAAGGLLFCSVAT